MFWYLAGEIGKKLLDHYDGRVLPILLVHLTPKIAFELVSTTHGNQLFRRRSRHSLHVLSDIRLYETELDEAVTYFASRQDIHACLCL
jgi:hypothetical protein